MEKGTSISALGASGVQLLCVLGVAISYWISHAVYKLSLISDPALVLAIFAVVQAPLVIGLYSLIGNHPLRFSYWRAVGRGLLGVPLGALLNAFGAIVLGAPVGWEHWAKTIYWSVLMSVLTFVPACCVFGSSKKDWRRLLVFTEMSERVDYMISLPAHGTVIGAWIGAWPMPLDWERPWQEWPICVTYGALLGYFLGLAVSLPIIFLRETHRKRD